MEGLSTPPDLGPPAGLVPSSHPGYVDLSQVRARPRMLSLCRRPDHHLSGTTSLLVVHALNSYFTLRVGPRGVVLMTRKGIAFDSYPRSSGS